jgi:hypothetical protein
MVSGTSVPEGMSVQATIVEEEGTTSVVTEADATRLGVQPDFVAAWLTLEMHSSLDAVGLTAAVATALAAEDIPCNVLAGYFHDHLLVPFDEAPRAIALLGALGSAHGRH